jgi:hypothetical protein
MVPLTVCECSNAVVKNAATKARLINVKRQLFLIHPP